MDTNSNSGVNPGARLPVPSFIRLFVIHRIIQNHSNFEDIAQITSVATEFDNDEKVELSTQVFCGLLKHGIKKYMEELFDETQQAVIVEQIFQKLIKTKFGKKYDTVTTYLQGNDNNHDTHHTNSQVKVFNMQDLMCSIFQFLTYERVFEKQRGIHRRKVVLKGGLYHSSLVSSNWLYHTWNINSIYHIDLCPLIYKTLQVSKILKSETSNIDINYSRNIIRQWQRFINAQSIVIYMESGEEFQVPDTLLFNRLAMLGMKYYTFY